MADYQFEALGHEIREPRRKLEVFPAPPHVTTVVLSSDEVTSLCPVTGQPDWDTVTIEYSPAAFCIESKSLKLYLWSFRNEGVFCESFAERIAQDVMAAARPHWCKVTVTQKPRGGITITATAMVTEEPPA